jgi:hypothetical protein
MVKHKILKTTVQVHLVPVDDEGELGTPVPLEPVEFRGRQGLTQGLPGHLADIADLAKQLDAQANPNRRQRRARTPKTEKTTKPKAPAA